MRILKSLGEELRIMTCILGYLLILFLISMFLGCSTVCSNYCETQKNPNRIPAGVEVEYREIPEITESNWRSAISDMVYNWKVLVAKLEDCENKREKHNAAIEPSK